MSWRRTRVERCWWTHTPRGRDPLPRGLTASHRIHSSLRGKAWADEGSSLGPDRHARDIESLDRYALERWEVILHFMVGSPSAAVSQDLAQLLTQAGLMRR